MSECNRSDIGGFRWEVLPLVLFLGVNSSEEPMIGLYLAPAGQISEMDRLEDMA